MPTNTSTKPAQRRMPLPAIIQRQRREAILADILSDPDACDAWADATADSPLDRDTGMRWLGGISSRATRADGWEG